MCHFIFHSPYVFLRVPTNLGTWVTPFFPKIFTKSKHLNFGTFKLNASEKRNVQFEYTEIPNPNLGTGGTPFFSKYFCLKTLNFGTFILNASEKQNVQFECTKNSVTLVPRLVGTRRKTPAIHKKNGTQSRENAGHIDCIKIHSGDSRPHRT